MTPQIDVTASFTIPGAGAYALVVADEMNPSIVVPPVDQPLTGVDLVELPAAALATGTVSPSTLPPGGGSAAGSLAIQSPTPLPSGTIVQALVTESYNLTTGAVASEEQRTEDIVLYRQPAAQSPRAPAPALTAFFPITPSRSWRKCA